MNSIAPGPFEMNRRPSAGSGLRSNRPGSRDDNARRPSTASSSGSAGRAPPRMPRKNGYGGFGPPQKNDEDFEPPSLATNKRSETFPKPTPSPMDELPARTPSAPGLRQDRMRSATANVENGPMGPGARGPRPSFSIKDTSRPPPPRKSLIRPPTRDGSTTPSINLADEFGESNPYHSPSISQSSSQSGYSQRSSQRSQASSSTSPARSVGARRIPSDGPPPKVEDALDDFQMTIDAMPLPPLGTGPSPRPRAPSAEDMTAPRPAPIPPPRRGPIPEALRLDPAAQTGQQGLSSAATSPPLRSPMFPSQSRRDPAIQAGQGSPPLRSPVFANNDSIDSNISTTTNNNNNDRQDPAVQEPRSRSPPPRRPSHNRQPSQARARGNCKACGEAITGKSIASADGRLTGRYHKACFVCATCRSPFAGTTFYVLGDRPYCERHYHALNGSLCGSCDRGIEGQYLEDEAARSKHHPGCFRCRDCGVVLRDGYFDVGGANLCERDAVRRVQHAQMMMMRQPPGGGMGPGQGQYGGPPFARGGRGGLPSGPSPPAPGPLNRPFGLPMGQRLMPGQALGRGGLGPMPKMEKRMTRLGMMGPA
ncbi:hypothetical protein SLS62_002376 [Diatrype stigma]|uniref:LIM zinc-binding domain-containing protein n=1 Tax=Diatrype stigma TaxID=117547 RepID=A0AAN9YR13_9PEZI